MISSQPAVSPRRQRIIDDWGVHLTGVERRLGQWTVPTPAPTTLSPLGEFQAWFSTDADCLEWLRWPCGFVYPSCGYPGGWRLGDGRFMCTACGSRTSVMAGTIFDRTRTPLTVWFSVCWHFATGKDGISALSLKRTVSHNTR